MIRNYFKAAWRNLRKNKIYSFINIFGLTAGLTCFLLIALYIFDELTFDRFHQNAGSIYRIVEEKKAESGKESKVVSVNYNVSGQGKRHIPEIMEATRFSMLGRVNVFNADHVQGFYEAFNMADANFFRVFNFPVVDGSTHEALDKPFTVVLNEETAIRIFGTPKSAGKSLRVDTDSLPYKVSAVVKIPANSHIQFNILFSEASISNPRYLAFTQGDWTSNNYVTYLQLKPGADITQTSLKINKLVASNRNPELKTRSNFYLQPLADIHFKSAGLDGNLGPAGNIMHMYVFGIVALFVLLIASINYMNLATARFSSRSKEIAVRKVSGADRSSLIKQFLTESFLICSIAFVLSLMVIKFILPAFNAFSGKKLSLNLETDFRIWTGMVAILVVVALLSGLYPAFFQSKLKPYLLLKGRIPSLKNGLSLRKGLVVVQFSLSIIMIIATIVVYQQLKFVSTTNMGFNKQQLVVVDINSGAVRRSAEAIKADYASLPGVKSVSVSSRVPGEWKILPKVKVRKPVDRTSEGDDMFYIAADDQFLNTFEIDLVAGRNFSSANPSDSSAVILNETAAKQLGITAPSEQLIEIPSISFSGNSDLLDQPFVARVIGIVKDFNFQSLRDKVGPMVVAWQRNPIHNIDYFTARVESGSTSKLLEQMETVLRKVDAGHLFEYNFLDKQWELFYREDEKRQIIFMGVALMTILIACLGLLGLATYAAEQRIKEIGVRKVLGASTGSIVSLLSKDFLKLVFIASLFAFPIAWWSMSNWLRDFSYRVTISAWVFLIAAALALLIALLTVSFQAIRAAMNNPVKSLRSE